jgi:hypothetical protein
MEEYLQTGHRKKDTDARGARDARALLYLPKPIVLHVPPKLISVQSCTEPPDARDISSSLDDARPRVTTATIATHARAATAPILILRVLLSGKCVASMPCSCIVLRLPRTNAAELLEVSFFFNQHFHIGGGESNFRGNAAAAA